MLRRLQLETLLHDLTGYVAFSDDVGGSGTHGALSDRFVVVMSPENVGR